MRVRFVLSMLFFLFTCFPVAAERADISGFRVDTTPTKSERELIARCDLIVVGWSDSTNKEYPTAVSVPNGRVVNFVQSIQVKKALKGSSPNLVQLLTTGIEPLPDASDPINLKYPGPLAEGNYILFLQPVKGTDLHSIVGLWQGVYPIIDGKTVALEGAGYKSFNDLTITQMENELKKFTR